MIIRRPSDRILTIPGIGINIIQGRVGAAGGFSPTDIAGLQLWLKADAGTYQDAAMTVPAVLDTDPVGGWQDQSGNGNHVTQAVADNKPILKLNIVNGLPVTRYDGTNDYLDGGDKTFNITNDMTVFIAKYDITSITNMHFYLSMQNGATGFGCYMHEPTLEDRFIVKASRAWGVDWARPVGLILNAWNLGIYRRSGITTSFARNNNAFADDAGSAGPIEFGTPAKFNVGSSATANNIKGDIAEIILYNAALAGADLINVETYLNSRYAIW